MFANCDAPTSQDSNAEKSIAVDKPPNTRPRQSIANVEPWAVSKQQAEYIKPYVSIPTFLP